MAAFARGGLSRAALAFLRGSDQVLERFLRSAAQLTSECQRQQAAPPPGREVEVSIEPDQRSALFGLGEGDVLLVLDSERKADQEIDPARLRVHVAHLHSQRPFAPEGRSGEVERLTWLHRARWLC